MIKRFLFTALFVAVLFKNPLLAQETLNYEGKSYKVYPYRMEYSNNKELEIPFYPGRLEDGDYAVLFTLPHDYSYPPKDFGTNKYPGALIHIVNGVKEGNAVFFYNLIAPKNKLLVSSTGNYKAGLKTGIWKHYDISYYGVLIDSTQFEYENGLLNGTKIRWSNGIVICSENYKNGRKNGLTVCDGSRFWYSDDTLDGFQIDSNFSSILKVNMYHGRRSDTFLIEHYNLESGTIQSSNRTVVLKRFDSTFKFMDSSKFYMSDDYQSGFLQVLAVFRNSYQIFRDITRMSYDSYDKEYIYFKTEFFDSMGRIEKTKYYINKYERIAEVDRTELTYEYTTKKPKHKNYVVSKHKPYRNSRKKISYYFIPKKSHRVLKAIYADSVLGTVYRETLELDGRLVLEQDFCIHDFSKVLLHKRKYSFSDIARNVEINKTYDDSLETFSALYYLQKLGTVPKYYLRTKYPNSDYAEWAYIDSNAEERTFFIRSFEEDALKKLTGNGVVSVLDNGNLLLQSIDLKTDKHHSVAIVWTDTVCLSKKLGKSQLLNLSTSNYYSSSIGDAIRSEGIPVKMGFVYLDGIAYSGNLIIYAGSKIDKNPIILDIPKETWKSNTLHVPFYMSSDEEFSSYRMSSNIARLKMTNIYDGYATGSVELEEFWGTGKKYSTKRTNKKSQSSYLNGIHSSGNYYWGLLHSDFYKWHYYGNQHLNYRHGQLRGLQVQSGIWEYRNSENFIYPGASTMYIDLNGNLHGQASILISNTQYFTVELQNGKPFGSLYSYQSNLMDEEAHFNAFGLHGNYKAWYYDSDNDTTFLILEAKAKNNQLVDTLRTYFIDGKPSCILVLDAPIKATLVETDYKDGNNVSISGVGDNRYSNYSGNDIYDIASTAVLADSLVSGDTLQPEDPFLYYDEAVVVSCSGDGVRGTHEQLIEFSPEWSGYYQYFYKSGHKSQEGRVFQGKRTGIWKFYNESGYLYKEVDYKTGKLQDPFDISKTIEYKGKCKGYNNFGKAIYEGLIVDENFDYTCATEAAITFQDIFYTAVYDSLGANILQANTYVPVQEYQISGAKLFDGWWYNGHRDSIWKFYDGGGNLNEIGKYVGGERDGRWISGDLIGINYIDNACFKTEDDYRIAELRKQLEFTETIWEHGKSIAEQKTEVQTDGFTKSYGWYGFKKMGKLPFLMSKRKKKLNKYERYEVKKRNRRRHLSEIY